VSSETKKDTQSVEIEEDSQRDKIPEEETRQVTSSFIPATAW